MDGVLLVNLGTPSAPTAAAVRRYLAEFLADPRVVELPRWIWLPILYGIVLRTRPAKSAKKYQAVWTSEGSPLAVHTQRQADLLRAALSAEKISVQYAMRYGEPTIAQGLKNLSDCGNIVVLPLYPQFSRSTTESIRDVLGTRVRMVENFHDHPAYIAALAAGVQQHWAAHGKSEKLVMSFHGLPQRAVDRGDPYHAQCLATAKILAGTLRIAPTDLYSMDEAIRRLASMLGRLPDWANLMQFLPVELRGDLVSRSALAATFVAALQLVKEGRLRIRQGEIFGPVYIRAARETEDMSERGVTA